MSKGWQGNFFEDFAIGQRIAGSQPRTITAGDVALYIALTGDRTPAFCGELGLVHPLVVFHTVFGQTVRAISLNARANLGYANLRFGAPVRVGATLRAEMTIVGLKENSSRTTGVVWVHTVGRDQDDEIVLEYTRWVMIKKRHSEATSWLEGAVVPELPAAVAVGDLPLATAQLAHDRSASGQGPRMGEYTPGERVFHFDGMQVNPSDHMSFTRLFQNSAKVHFDPAAGGGRPLVYGGVVISAGYAASHNGFDGRLGICAINAGAHANPVAAGDVLYAATEVLECSPTADPLLGALRLRLLVYKGVEPSTLPEADFSTVDDPEKPGRRRLRSDIVLDLDYWELVPHL